MNKEIESTLIICSENPQEIAQEISEMNQIDIFKLLHQDSQDIHDLYIDTPDQALQTRKLSLRIRKINSKKHKITLKGPSLRTIQGCVERLEIEDSWSENALTRVVNELKKRGINISLQHQALEDAHPVDVMKSLGLKVIQDRKTHRQVRNIVKREESGPILAELAIDTVTYHFNDHDIHHHEVEVEAKVEDYSKVLKIVVDTLSLVYGDKLKRWDYSKLATGMAIEKLVEEVSLKGLLDKNNLKPVGYEKIKKIAKKL